VLIFLFPLIGIVFALLSGLCHSKSWPFDYATGFFALAILGMWALFAVHLPMAATFGDSCLWLDEAEQDPQTTLGWNTQQTAIAQACLVNVSLIDALNLSDALRFATVIDFPPIPDIPSAFTSPELTQLQSLLNTVTPTNAFSAYPSDSTINQLLVELNQLTSGSFTRANVITVDPTVYPNVTAVRQHKWDILTLLDAQIVGNQKVMGSQALVNGTVSSLPQAESAAMQVSNDLDLVNVSLTAVLIAGDNLVAAASCGDLGDIYRTFKSSWCDILATAFSFLALACFLIGSTGWVAYLLEKMSHKRLPNPESLHGSSKPTGAEMQQMSGHHTADI